jgi:hypothetical protein
VQPGGLPRLCSWLRRRRQRLRTRLAAHWAPDRSAPGWWLPGHHSSSVTLTLAGPLSAATETPSPSANRARTVRQSRPGADDRAAFTVGQQDVVRGNPSSA